MGWPLRYRLRLLGKASEKVLFCPSVSSLGHGDMKAGASAAILGGDTNMKLERWKLSAKSEHKLEKSLGPDAHDMELFYSFDLFTSRCVFPGDKRKLSLVCVSVCFV